MDDSLKRTAEILAVVNHLLDPVIESLESSENEGLREQAKLADDAWHLLMSVGEAVYAFAPQVAPPWRSGESAFLEETQEYGRLLLAMQGHWANRQYHDALQLWRAYLEGEHSYLYEMLAKRLLAHLEETVKRLESPPNPR